MVQEIFLVLEELQWYGQVVLKTIDSEALLQALKAYALSRTQA